MTPEQQAKIDRLQEQFEGARWMVEHYREHGPREMINDAKDQLDDAHRALQRAIAEAA